MDQIKIGRFIAERRKAVGLTQMQLSEQLGVTDRAVSKWECGKAMPDSSIMLSLCEILKITVNDLLSGEIVTMENYNKEMENKLIEGIKKQEQSDRLLLVFEVVIGVLSTLILLIPIIFAAYLPIEDWQRIILAFSGFIPAIVGFFFAIRIEQVVGYYECKECGKKHVPGFKSTLFAMHLGRTRYLKCPHCQRRSWQKKTITNTLEPKDSKD